MIMTYTIQNTKALANLPGVTDIDDSAAANCSGGRITLFDAINFGGKSVSVDNNIGNFQNINFNDKVSSVKVESGIWQLSEAANNKGDSIVLRPGSYNFVEDFGLDNDTLSSVKRV